MRRMLIVVGMAFLGAGAAAQNGPWWVIGHMSNSVEAVNWAADVGANGVEADLRFDADGNPTVFNHGAPCDCSCLISYGVCKYLGKKPCESTVAADTLLAAVAKRASLGLV